MLLLPSCKYVMVHTVSCVGAEVLIYVHIHNAWYRAWMGIYTPDRRSKAPRSCNRHDRCTSILTALHALEAWSLPHLGSMSLLPHASSLLPLQSSLQLFRQCQGQSTWD